MQLAQFQAQTEHSLIALKPISNGTIKQIVELPMTVIYIISFCGEVSAVSWQRLKICDKSLNISPRAFKVKFYRTNILSPVTKNVTK